MWGAEAADQAAGSRSEWWRMPASTSCGAVPLSSGEAVGPELQRGQAEMGHTTPTRPPGADR